MVDPSQIPSGALEALFQAVKRPIQLAHAKLFGFRLVILGPVGAGKSSLAHYLKHQQLQPLSHHTSTLGARLHEACIVDVGSADGTFKISSFVDTVGQSSDTAGADVIGTHRADLLIIVIDGSESVETNVHYIAGLCRRIADLPREDMERIKAYGIFANKFDDSQSSETFFEAFETLQKEVGQEASEAIRSRLSYSHTIMIDSNAGSSLVDHALLKLAEGARA